MPPAVDVAALLKDYKGDASSPPARRSSDAGEPRARTQRYTLPNGSKVALLPKKTRGDTVRFTLRLHQGDEKSLFGTCPPASLMGAMLSRGTQKRDRQAFDDELDRLRASSRCRRRETATAASGETVRENLAEVLRLAAEALRDAELSRRPSSTS